MAKIKGTSLSETLNGTAFSDKIHGKGGDDTINGLDGNDDLFGDKGDDIINGGAGNDKINGEKGDDTLNGGAGDDKIDGGKGEDTAVFGGNYDAYTIAFAAGGQHGWCGYGDDNLKLTVTGLDGTDQLKSVEWLKFDDALFDAGNNLVYFADATLSLAAQDPASLGNMFAGSGIPADHFGIVRSEDAGVELGLKVHRRFDSPATILHSDADGYADGELHFQVDAGPGNLAGDRAEWNFDFSIATGLNGATTDLSDFTFKLKYDVDKTAGTDYRVLTLEAESTPQGAGQSGFQWRDQGTGLVFISDDEGNANVTQNSENFGFGFIRPFIDDDAGTPGTQTYNFGPGEFDIVLQAYQGWHLVAANHIVVDVV